jgi:methyltransferase (TIGR00027 family)
MASRSRPSLTARNVARVRRGLERPTVASGDPAGEDRLVDSLGLVLPVQVPGLAAYIRERTEFFDNTLLDACAAGAQQVVIVGAGYDGRSLRYRQPGVTFYEVDHPATQADKQARLRRAGADASDVRFVAVDFGHESIAERLGAAGHDADVVSHFICEGVTPYLPNDDLTALVDDVAERAAPGSTLAIDFAQRSTSGLRDLMLRAVRTGTALMGERMVTMLSADEAVELLERGGWPRVRVHPVRGPFPVVHAVASRT